MKRLSFTATLILFLLSWNVIMAQDKMKEKEDKTKMKDGDSKVKVKDDKIKIKDENGKMKIKTQNGMNGDMPYTALYSSNFIIGNQANAKIVLDAWKDWDDNALTRHNFMADTIVVFLPDGSVMKGKEAAGKGFMQYRGTLTNVKSTIDVWLPLRSVDKKENWVAIWGTETDTHADGKVDSTEIHEIWRINKDGKVDYMRQYTGKPAAQQ